MGIHCEAKLNRKFVELAKLLNIYLNHFPKHEKFALANKIRTSAYDIYDHIIESQKRYYKKTTLTALDIAHEKLRMQLYLAISVMVDELGKMIGGWIKKIKEDNQWKCLFKFRRRVMSGDVAAVVSLLGHARRTQSLQYMINIAREADNAVYNQLPEVYRQIHNVLAVAA